MENKIFNYTREQLVDMFEPLSEFHEKVNEITMEQTRMGYGFDTADCNADCMFSLQERINSSRMSKADKEYVINMVGSLIINSRYAGMIAGYKEYGHFDEEVKAYAAKKVEDFKDFKKEFFDKNS